MPTRIYVWDIVVRLFHWSLVAAFAANALVTDAEKLPHRWVGYGIAVLLALRLCWGVIGTKHARFTDFPPSASASIKQMSEMVAGRRHVHPGHSPLGALMIYNVLATLIGIVISGYAMTTLAFFGVDWVQGVHEALVTWAEISVVVHIVAVVVESRRLRVNLPKSMLTGYKEVP